MSRFADSAYGRTAEEIALMWQTAPPRMPGEPPPAGEKAVNAVIRGAGRLPAG